MKIQLLILGLLTLVSCSTKSDNTTIVQIDSLTKDIDTKQTEINTVDSVLYKREILRHFSSAFPFKIWTNETNYQVGLVDAGESPWSHVTFLGQILNRNEGLKHEWIKEVFHITDHIVAEDKVVIEFFAKSGE